MTAPCISVIIPSYNHVDYLAECLDSVVAQTFRDFEVIIVNDGSTDATKDIAQRYAQAHDYIRYVEQPNQGVVVARNTGVAQARGEYIFPLDGDDKIAPECLEKLYHVMKQGIFDVVYSQTEFFGARTGLFELDLPDRKNMYDHNHVVCSALYRKADWERYGGYDLNMKDGWEDWEFWLNFINDGKTFYRINETLFFYRIKDASRNNTIAPDTAKRLRSYVTTKHAAAIAAAPKPVVPWRYKAKMIAMRPFMSRKTIKKIAERYGVVTYPKTPDPKLIMTLLVKDEADIIEQNLIYHHAQGVDGFVVTDNTSSDGTREILQKYQDKGWILDIIDEPSQDYSQYEWVNRMVVLAQKKYKPDWIINADADEFWSASSGNLKDEIAQVTTNKIFVPIYSMLPHQDGNYLDNTHKLVKALPKDVQDKLKEEGRLSQFSQFSMSIPKVIHRSQDYKHIHMGNHNVDMVYRGKSYIASSIQIYHYNLRGLDHFHRKLVTGGKAYERNTKLGKDVGAHWRYFYEGFRDGTLNPEQEYKKSIGALCQDEIKHYGLIQNDDTVQTFFKKR